ncbi:putative glycine dehydrogenase (decarboxylating) subunit 1 [Frankliniella fusca]|uniref:Glycine dehydrogenase (Decarboxylating) subunit 1 n=1 Tax=Frankliniella fusca TaxID=407009 RepID=A0AAE1GY90_9NEOP|nr:putative glycine dehydrogenase (decarboxylating) subunit 1 [Frankliniella fusca]
MPTEKFNHWAFTNDILRRAQLAAAVHIIKSAPKGVSAETYATDLQRKLKLLWLNSPMAAGASHLNLLVDRQVLFKLQELLAFRLSSIISESCQGQQTVFCENESTCKETHEQFKVQALYDNLNANRSNIQATTSFIQAIIHLKALAESQTTVPFDKYFRSVSSMCDRMKLLNFPQYDSEDRLIQKRSLSDDSGFCTLDDRDANKLVEPVKGLASSFILYIINSGNANELLQKSMESIIIQLRGITIENPGIHLNETINQWQGSVYYHALLALQPIFSVQQRNVERSVPSQQLCVSVFKEILDHICDENYSAKHDYYLRENQIVMLFQLCFSTNLWIQVLDIVFQKIEDLAHLMKWTDSIDEEKPEEISFYQDNRLLSTLQNYLLKLESSFFVFQLAHLFLQNIDCSTSENKGQQNTLKENVENKKTSTISHRWRKHYATEMITDTRTTSDESKTKVTNWKIILSDSFRNSLFKNSLIAIKLCKYMPQLSALALK